MIAQAVPGYMIVQKCLASLYKDDFGDFLIDYSDMSPTFGFPARRHIAQSTLAGLLAS